jgi:hypothetical protein
MKLTNLKMPRQSKRKQVIEELNSFPDKMLEDLLKYMSELKAQGQEYIPDGFSRIAEMKGKYRSCKFSSQEFMDNKNVEKSHEL